MKYGSKGKMYRGLSTLLCVIFFNCLQAQTDADAIMMARKNLCIGPMYSYSEWQDYWEGTLKRNNQNLGTVSTKAISVMANYGITSKLNVLVSVPYIKTKASAGTMHGMSGVQDMTMWLKWRPLKTALGKGKFSVYGIGGFSVPLTSYVADYLPLAIGLRSKSASARVMADYEIGKFFVTGSGTYTARANVNIDRTSYYTTGAHLTNKVEMPDVAAFNFRTGHRSKYLIAEVVFANMTTLSGYDIRRNDMPFLSNKMIATTAGINVKYTVKQIRGLELTAGGNRVIAGRNVGKATTVNAGLFCIIDFARNSKKVITNTKAN